MSHTLQERIAARRKLYYREVKAHSPALFQRAIRSAEAVSLNFDLPMKAAVEVEWACVASLADGLGIGSPMTREEIAESGERR